jgi:Aspartyl protease
VVLRLLLIHLVWLIVSAVGPGLLASPPAKPTLIINLIPHPGGTEMMTLHARVRGHEGNFIFDTGGGISYISPAFAQTIGCKPWGQITGFTLTAQRLDMPRCDGLSFEIEGHGFGAPTSGVFDIMKFMPADVPRIDGSIGLDVFEGLAVTLSLAQRKLIVESPSSLRERTKLGKEVPVRLVREVGGIALAVQVAVPTTDGMAWMELDSGNGGANVIGKHLVAVMKLDPNQSGPQPASFMIAGGVPVEGMVRVNDKLTMDGNIGTRFLINWDLTLDLAKGRAWLTRVKSQ